MFKRLLLAVFLSLASISASAIEVGQTVNLGVFYMQEADALAEMTNPTAEFTDKDRELIQAGRLVIVPPNIPAVATVLRLVAERDNVRLGQDILRVQAWELDLNSFKVYWLVVVPATRTKGVSI